MKIKNPHIIHMLRRRWYKGFTPSGKPTRYVSIGYVCINCYTKEKSTKDWNKVTCKNCLTKNQNKTEEGK